MRCPKCADGALRGDAQRVRGGRIVIGTVGGREGRAFGQAKISAYARGRRAAVVALGPRSLALEEAKNGITVNVVNRSA